MANRTVSLLIFLFILSLAACDKVDVRGAFIAYQSVNERFDQSMNWNQNNAYKDIQVNGSSYELFAMGDSHVGGTKNLNLFFMRANASNALAIVAVGDLTTGRADDYEVFCDNLGNSGGIDIFPMAGNHDLYFDGWKEYYSRLGSSTYYFTVNTADTTDLFICLDSGSGTLGSKQLSWLKDLLEEERTKHRYCVIFSHVNFFRTRHASTTNPQIEEIHVLMDLFLAHRVDMVVTGHDHKKSTETIGNTKYLVMDALLDGYKEAGYLILSVDNAKGLNYRFVNF